MSLPTKPAPHADDAVEIRVRGLVQGVGFRPAVWRLAVELGLSGEVLNDSAGLLVRVAGPGEAIAALQRRLAGEAPRLARVEAIEAAPWRPAVQPCGFRIVTSRSGETRTDVAADVGICAACRDEVLDPTARRHGYALTNCTNCGPRFSIIESMPYDRARTTMAGFAMCADCRREYEDPADRRFHAEPIACPACGPRARLVSLLDAQPGVFLPSPAGRGRGWGEVSGQQLIASPHPFPLPAGEGEPVGARARCPSREDVTSRGIEAIESAVNLLRAGHCVAIKGIGGYQLACDATNAAAVMRLREAKRRPAKPFALMARDIDVVRRHAQVSAAEEAALRDPAAPIVLLDARAGTLPDAVAPGLDRLGFMLAATPLHLLLLEDFETPVIMTSGNVAGAPQIIDDACAIKDLAGLATHVLMHDRPIARRVDDAVVQMTTAGPQVLRLGRGFAPLALPLPAGLEAAPQTLALGPDLKATACLVKDGAAIVSSHLGDLDEADTFDEYVRNLDELVGLYDAAPEVLACDLHPDYRSTEEARRRAARDDVRLEQVQHHHAHVASCLAEHRYPLDAPPVLGIALDGLGLGDDGTLWGGELLIADYRGYRRVGRLTPVAMPGGARAAREPWRNLYAHLVSTFGWEEAQARFGDVPAVRDLARQPIVALDQMMAKGINAPLSSSCGRLFDAVAAACGVARAANGYEGEAAMRLEAAARAEQKASGGSAEPYPFSAVRCPKSGLIEVAPVPMWSALLGDLVRGATPQRVALRFHLGLADALVEAAAQVLADERSHGRRVGAIVLTGGVVQNRLLLDALAARFAGFDTPLLLHARVPPGDGGLALGQAVVGAARAMARAASLES